MSIPKIIHYCWFGPKPIPELELRCIESWKKFLPDYEFNFWNEKTYNLEKSNRYVKGAYQSKYFAFVTDYVRLDVMNKFGGVYLDTDIELLSSIDSFLDNEAFTGFENKTSVAAGIIGCKKGNVVIQQMLEHYDSIEFIDSNNNFNITTICSVLMNFIEKEGFEYRNSNQNLKNIRIYERENFYPKKMNDGSYRVTNKAISIHHYSGSWLTPRQKKRGENIIWRKICRPALRKCKNVLFKLVGARNTSQFENKIRNWLR